MNIIHRGKPKYMHSMTGKARDQLSLQLMVIPGLLSLIIFCYIPIFNNVIAFQEYNFILGIAKSPWVGLKQFYSLFSDADFYMALRNTFFLGFSKFILNFFIPIIFALLLNEINSVRIKKIAQTSSYMPHFLAYVVVASLFSTLLANDGLINQILISTGIFKNPVDFLTEKSLFVPVAAVMDCWKEMGWNAIIFISAMAGINNDLYESASIDGANRIKRIFSITIPSIIPTMMVVFVLNFANMLGSGVGSSNFDQSLLLGNTFNHESSYVIQYYILDNGLRLYRFSYSAAAGLVMTCISMILLYFSNIVAKKISDGGIFKIGG